VFPSDLRQKTVHLAWQVSNDADSQKWVKLSNNVSVTVLTLTPPSKRSAQIVPLVNV